MAVSFWMHGLQRDLQEQQANGVLKQSSLRHACQSSTLAGTIVLTDTQPVFLMSITLARKAFTTSSSLTCSAQVLRTCLIYVTVDFP
jgi:hypothetical protein